MKKTFILLILALLIFTIYCKFYIYSYDITDNDLPSSQLNYFTDEYLIDLGYVRHPDCTGMFYSKKDIFKINLNGKIFQDSCTINFYTEKSLKPLYLFYTIQMNPKVDKKFVSFFNLKTDSMTSLKVVTLKDQPQYESQTYYYKINDTIEINRYLDIENEEVTQALYRVNPQMINAFDNLYLLKRLFYLYIKVLHDYT
ncbi:MAG: hypothetical protein D8M58_00015 [Calditrichaeota bacterium]|nr:MAG: hypothetical protein DWQ03_07065 [Calditrichota bacterium]MBL1203753.1 hypothetical protein [Calditrichota bacterium]NOG43585.1 hypothetical protein [Calditrichota bacterium]